MSKIECIMLACILAFIFCLIVPSVNAWANERREKKYEVTPSETKSEKEIIASYAQKSSNYTGNINVFFGQKKFNKIDWLPVEKQKNLGIEIDFKEPDWDFSMTVSYLISEDDSSGDDRHFYYYEYINGETSELQIGIKKILDFQHSDTHPFWGGGITFIRAKEYKYRTNETPVTAADNTVGIWISGGCYITVYNNVNIGFNVRYSFVNTLLNDDRISAGGLQYGALAGFHF